MVCVIPAYAEEQPVTSLKLVVTAHHGHTYSEPGDTTVELVTSPSAESAKLYETLQMHALRLNVKFKPGQWLTSEENPANGETGIDTREISWSCETPGESYTLTATARSTVGATVTATGEFREDLTARWCAKAKKAEKAANRRFAREEQAEGERLLAKERNEKEQPKRELEQWEGNCRQLGGHVVWLHVGDAGAVAPYCRGPNGGTIAVPS
jgi:hypothetical protein